jgi:hypothetical protein
VIEDAKDWLRARAGKVLVIGTGSLLAISLLSLGTNVLGAGPEDANAQAQVLVDELESDLETTRTELADQHRELLAGLPGMDIERVGRDRATGRTLLLSLTDSSASSQNVLETQQRLDARYEALDPDSRTLTEFIPEWMAVTGAGQGTGTAFLVGELTVDLIGVQGLDYSYVGIARMDPASVDGEPSEATSEFVLYSFSTLPDGTVTDLEAYRVSGSTRDALLSTSPSDTGGEDG